MRSRLAYLLLFACVPLALAACGDDDEGGSEGPAVFVVEATDDGVTAPKSAEPGALEIRFTNSGKQDHSGQIVSLGDGHTAAEVKKAGEAWGEKGRPLPDWLAFHGGIGDTRPGQSATGVVDLEPGDYAVFDINGRGDQPYAEFTVEGDEGEDLPETDGSITAQDYSFEAEGLEAGRTQVLFENAGEEPHHLIAAPLKPGKTIEDVKKSVQGGGPPPVDEKRTVGTAILSGGTSALVDVDLQAGDYALVCFIPDRKGGPPHAVKGMISEASVE